MKFLKNTSIIKKSLNSDRVQVDHFIKISDAEFNKSINDRINNLHELKKEIPGLLPATFEWFKKYKLPTKNKLNEFAFGEKA